jgi:hypothetical protein
MFKMGYFDKEFSTKKMQKENPLNEFVMIDGLIVPVSALMEVLGKKIAQLQKEIESEEGEFVPEEDLETEEK